MRGSEVCKASKRLPFASAEHWANSWTRTYREDVYRCESHWPGSFLINKWLLKFELLMVLKQAFSLVKF